MMRTTRTILFAFAFCTTCFLWLPACALAGQGSAEGTGKITDDRETLGGKLFQFSWSSDGIGSPNETTWWVDAAGRLLFKHADGRVSTRYDEVRLAEGLLCFEGPFLFREGITHHLIEIEGAVPEWEHRMTPEQTARIKYSPNLRSIASAARHPPS